MRNIAQKITKRSDTAGVLQDTADIDKRNREEDYSRILSAKYKNTDIDSIKAEIKGFCHADVDMPKPKDVIKTKAGQIIIRMRTKQETETILDKLKENTAIKEKIKITMPNKRREIMLILNVEPDVTEKELKSALKVVLELGGGENLFLQKIKKMLLDPVLDIAIKNAIEKLLNEQK